MPYRLPYRSLRYRFEHSLARLLLETARWLGPFAAAETASRLATLIGPRLSVSAVAVENLAAALPQLSDAERSGILRAMWENLGRTVAEFVHLPALRETPSGPGYEIKGEAHLLAPPTHTGPAIYLSAHFGNWELLPKILADRGAAFAPVYRPGGNPWIDRAIQRLRTDAAGRMPAFPKGPAGARAATMHLARGGRLGMLVDQKLNEGIEVPFLGRPAMTTPFPAQLALRYRCPVILGCIERIGPLRFRLTVDPPLPLPDSGDPERDVRTLTCAINQVLERWIRMRPDHWLWLHRRWPRQRHPAPRVWDRPPVTSRAVSPDCMDKRTEPSLARGFALRRSAK
jgi:KDO2-lipid IV(A) lauroyltransferase